MSDDAYECIVGGEVSATEEPKRPAWPAYFANVMNMHSDRRASPEEIREHRRAASKLNSEVYRIERRGSNPWQTRMK